MTNYRILHICGGGSLCTQLLSTMQSERGSENPSYLDLLQSTIDSRLWYGYSFNDAFKSLGNLSTLVIPDFELAQKLWAAERGLDINQRNWSSQVLFQQINSDQPDVVLIHGTYFSRPGLFSMRDSDDNLLTLIKSHCPGIKIVGIFSGYPSDVDRIRGADVFFSSPPRVVDHYRRQGMSAELLYHAFDSTILQNLNNVAGGSNRTAFTFCGQARAPEDRYFALLHLLRETEIQLWLKEAETRPPQMQRQSLPWSQARHPVKELVTRGFRSCLRPFDARRLYTVSKLPYLPSVVSRRALTPVLQEKTDPQRGACSLARQFPDRINPPVFGLDMYHVLLDSDLTFNQHTDFAAGSVGNLRLFEATGVGTCLLTDSGHNMGDLFSEDSEVVTYNNIPEAVEKAAYLLDHPDIAREIGKTGQQRTLREHTIHHRAAQMDAAIRRLL